MAKWKKKSTRYYSDLYDGNEILLAKHIIGEAYDEGIINWNMYKKAMDKIKTNSNGSWMFKEKIKKFDYEKHTTKYITENMGEVTVIDCVFKYINGKYNSKDIQIANLGLVGFDFEENFDYIMNIINQYSKIYEITKKAIIENYNNDESIKYFFEFNFDKFGEEKIFELFDIKTLDEFDINKVVDRLPYPRLYFEFSVVGRKITFVVQYHIIDKTDDTDVLLEVCVDDNLDVLGFQTLPEPSVCVISNFAKSK